MKKLLTFLKEHRLAIIFALLVGVIYLAPYIFFMASLGDKYQDIPMITSANEEYYLARMREITDGHPLVGSYDFYEYKNQWPLSPPTGEFLYILPTILFGVDLMQTDIATKFILPLILFLLVYFLVYNLSVGAGGLAKKINAIAAALLITLGYDLVDYKSLWLFFTGKMEYGDSFLTWARPVNPILGGIFLFAFLLFISLIIKKTGRRKLAIAGAAISLALMIMSYFFSWGVTVSVWAALILIYLFKKNYQVVKDLALMAALALIFTLPYWYISWQSSKSPWYASSVLRSGMFYTHYPVFNKVLIAALLFFTAITLIEGWREIKKDETVRFLALDDWQWFCLALLLGGLWVFNQQIITGLTIWPYHFVQYTIPLSMVVICVLLYNVIKKWQHYLWLLAAAVITMSSLIFGIMIQVKAYQSNFDYYAKLQTYQPVFDWLNQQEKDCVVFNQGSVKDQYNWGGYILAFSHCNTYANNWSFSLMPDDRLYHNYLAHLRLLGVMPDSLGEYLKENSWEYRGYLFSNWKGLYNLKDFSDFSDNLLAERIKSVPEDYRRFYANDFSKELSKYRLDYFFSEGPISQAVLNQLTGTELNFSYNNIYLYKFKK